MKLWRFVGKLPLLYVSTLDLVYFKCGFHIALLVWSRFGRPFMLPLFILIMAISLFHETHGDRRRTVWTIDYTSAIWWLIAIYYCKVLRTSGTRERPAE